MPKKQSRFLDVQKVKVQDRFFSPLQRLVREVMLPYEEQVLRDQVPGVKKSHAIANFQIAAGELNEPHYGMVFQDSDLAKWIEASAYCLALQPDAALEERLDELIDLIRRAQQPDGYLDTYFIVKKPGEQWQNLRDCHELYCAGHMVEAAVAYYQATGKDTLLQVVCRLCDHIDARFGEGKQKGVPGHEEIELALLKLYRVTGEERYRKLASYFLNERGQDPDFFHKEALARGEEDSSEDDPPEYYQIHQPVREQRTVEGHAVRCMYLLTAMADYAAVADDEPMWEACQALWQNMTEKRMYLTGGIGSTTYGEAFTLDYDLPNDSIYAETCASVGACFVARQMLEAEPDRRYADILERELYNGAISGMQQDGRHFFYVNPLEVDPAFSGKLWGYRHVLPQRPGWYDCACCPPNLARLLASLGSYVWSEDAASKTVYSHLFVGGTASFAAVPGLELSLTTNYPWEGSLQYRVEKLDAETDFTLAIRQPSWCRSFRVFVNGEPAGGEMKKGYLRLYRRWQSGDCVTCELAMPVERNYAHPAVRADAGCVALMRGPLVYAFESTDNGEHLEAVRLPRGAAVRALPFDASLLGGVVPLEVEGLRLKDRESLYSTEPPEEEAAVLCAIPYYAWGNRGLCQMRVWIHE